MALKQDSQVSISQIRGVVPRELFRRSTRTGLYYTARSVGFPILLWILSQHIDATADTLRLQTSSGILGTGLRYGLWISYWWWQGITFAGIWCLGAFYFK
jgi:hypothetical protein